MMSFDKKEEASLQGSEDRIGNCNLFESLKTAAEGNAAVMPMFTLSLLL